MKLSKKRYAGLFVKSLLLGTLAIAVSINPLVLNEALAEIDKSSPKIAHGKLSIMEENIAGRTNRDNLNDAIFMALEMGELELADELLYELNTLERVGR